MRLPMTRDGRREVILATVVFAAGVGLGAWFFWPVAGVFGVLWLFVLAFFRDPERTGPTDPAALLAPADGKITEVTHLDNEPALGGPAVRIGIFLSIFDVHINRSPCDGRVVGCDYKRGRFLNALRPESSTENESNTVTIESTHPCVGRILVRQVAGLIARRIVCHCGPGDQLTRGQRFGMIKFGSRTELTVPAHGGLEITTRVGDKVRAGRTVLLRVAVEPPEPDSA